MPLRLPPPEPTPPKRGATMGQQRRYRHALHAWFVGNALREYAETKRGNGHSILDDISLTPSPRFDGLSGGRRYADDGTPRTMDDVCAAIDRQERVVMPIGRAYLQLIQEKSVVAQVAWRRHVSLMTIEEIAQAQGISSRTVIRMLSTANLYLMAALSGSPSGKTARELVRQSEKLFVAPLTEEEGDDELAIAGLDTPLKGTPKQK